MNESPVDLVSAAFVAAQAEFKTAGFDSTNPFFRSKYASFASVLEATRPILAKHGLAVLRKPSTEVDAAGKLWTIVETVIIHKSGQQLAAGLVRVPLELEKGRSLVQSWGAEVTYIGRYAWTTPLGIASDEDTDGHSPVGHTNRREASDDQDEPKNAPEAHCEPKPAIPEVTPATRMKMLNLLKAAPGQANRDMVKDFFVRAKGWLNADQQLEELPLEHIPKTQKQFAMLDQEIHEFSRRVAAPDEEGEKIV